MSVATRETTTCECYSRFSNPKGGAKNPYTSKDVLIGTFLIYHFKQKTNTSPVFDIPFPKCNFCTLNADKRPETAFSAVFLQNQDTRALRLIFATWCIVKGIVWELRCLLYPAIAVEQTAEE